MCGQTSDASDPPHVQIDTRVTLAVTASYRGVGRVDCFSTQKSPSCSNQLGPDRPSWTRHLSLLKSVQVEAASPLDARSAVQFLQIRGVSLVFRPIRLRPCQIVSKVKKRVAVITGVRWDSRDQDRRLLIPNRTISFLIHQGNEHCSGMLSFDEYGGVSVADRKGLTIKGVVNPCTCSFRDGAKVFSPHLRRPVAGL